MCLHSKAAASWAVMWMTCLPISDVMGRLISFDSLYLPNVKQFKETNSKDKKQIYFPLLRSRLWKVWLDWGGSRLAIETNMRVIIASYFIGYTNSLINGGYWITVTIEFQSLFWWKVICKSWVTSFNSLFSIHID